jgi:hypothetical protein
MTSKENAMDHALNVSGERPVHRWRRLLNRKLRMRVTVPALIGLIQLGLALVEMVNGRVPPLILLWLVSALVVGFGFGRATRVMWDSEASQFVLVGGQVVLTLAWLLVEVGSKALLPQVLEPLSAAGAIALLVACGLVFGRSLGLLGQIQDALRRQDTTE